MAATPSVKVIKSFSYQGGTKLWSNRYHFNGGTPADATHWNTFFDAIVALEKINYTSSVTIVECVGYNAGSEVPVASKAYTTAGTGTWGTAPQAPGACAILLRWSTTARSSKNHPIYLFNYYHGVYTGGVSNPDVPNATQKGDIDTYAAGWISGFSDGANTYVRAGPNGATATGHQVETYITHRDFPR
jgi:hypothetical protein